MTGISDKERQTLLSMVEDVAGPDVREVAIILLTHKGELTDEVISDELGIKLNQVRKALYLLADLDLASFREKEIKQQVGLFSFGKFILKKLEILSKKSKKMFWIRLVCV